ncbi:MAG TPA: ribose 5-phosphate isomerase B [Bacteroidales bacterium]|nr:ribose 5-phosphate isomerase B [Bacteroidales bacterium]
MKVAFACDHAGYNLKLILISYLTNKGYEITDLGCYSEESTDYPEYGHILANHITENKSELGISLCGTGNGINMTANKHPMIRSALCWDSEIAELARKHNDANICAIPARFITTEEAKKMVDVFLTTDFDGGRHLRRIEKIPV